MTIASMTGFGAAEDSGDTHVISAEIKTLNSRFLEISVSVPPHLAGLELEIRSLLQKYFIRGRVSLNVRVQAKKDSPNEPQYKELFAKKLATTVDMFRAHNLIPDGEHERQALLQVALSLVGKPISIDEPTIVTEVNQALITAVVHRAAEDSKQSRLREGEKLFAALSTIGQEIESATGNALAYLPEFKSFFENRLKQKLADTLAGFAENDPRLALEVTLQVERADCREELDRLVSHCQELKRLLQNEGSKSVGKELDFLAQEFARETSTLATKVQGTQLVTHARQLRILVEQLREQVQNIE